MYVILSILEPFDINIIQLNPTKYNKKLKIKIKLKKDTHVRVPFKL